MSTPADAPRERRRRVAAKGFVCPSCAGTVGDGAQRCPSCGFTGGDTISMFSDEAPPLLPVLDAAGIWTEREVRSIEDAREKVRRRFPQIQWRVCTVDLPEETKLSVFGFWLLNAAEKYVGETDDDRAWTILLLLNVATGHAAVVPGYAAERCLEDADLRKILIAMKPQWSGGRTVDAVIRFFETCAAFLEQSWRASGKPKARK